MTLLIFADLGCECQGKAGRGTADEDLPVSSAEFPGLGGGVPRGELSEREGDFYSLVFADSQVNFLVSDEFTCDLRNCQFRTGPCIDLYDFLAGACAGVLEGEADGDGVVGLLGGQALIVESRVGQAVAEGEQRRGSSWLWSAEHPLQMSSGPRRRMSATLQNAS